MTLQKRTSSSKSSSTMTTKIISTNNNNNNNNNWKISDSLLTLRAASLLSQQLSTFTKKKSQRQQQQHLQQGEEGRSFSSTTRRSLRDVVGDFGSVLFNPLDEDILLMMALEKEAVVEPVEECDTVHDDTCCCKKEMMIISECKPEIFISGSSTGTATTATATTTCVGCDGGCDKASLQESSTSEDSTEYQQELLLLSSTVGERIKGHDTEVDPQYIFDHEVFPVQIELPDDPNEYVEAPPILDVDSLQEIVDRALPRNLRIYKWKRIFSIAKDGDLFFTMLEQCSTFKHTLMVCRTTHGHVLGGFASEKWEDQDGYHKRHSYFGTGTCFLFSTHPRPSQSQQSQPDDDNDIPSTTNKHNHHHDRFSFYKWSGMNDYCQICDTDKGQIAMGGGSGDFGLVIEDGFFRGASGHCATFNNPPLIPGIDGTFEILDFEVYGLLPLLPTVSKYLSSSAATTPSDSIRSSQSKKYSPRSLLGRSPFY